jgi:NAD(P)-dependent dehydrogenase (short-subunit alcohol dehydrogenase family)
MKLKNKVAIVTGSGRGLGRAYAIELAREGAKVVVNDVNIASAEAAVKEIEGEGGVALADGHDVSKWSGGKALIDTAVQNWKRIDILVNNAAVLRDRTIWKMEEEDWDVVIDVCLKGTFICSRFAVPYMREQGWGRIINITSASGLRGFFGQSNYSAAKAGITGLTKTMAKELGKYGIRVNCVSPRALTPQLMTPDVMKNLNIKPGDKEADSPSTAIGKIRSPEAVAPMIVFLASEESEYITGQIIGVDGGVAGL